VSEAAPTSEPHPYLLAAQAELGGEIHGDFLSGAIVDGDVVDFHLTSFGLNLTPRPGGSHKRPHLSSWAAGRLKDVPVRTIDVPGPANDNWIAGAAGAPAKSEGTIDGDALLAKEFPPVNYVVPGYIVEGLTVLGGKPKLGKSWLMYDFGIAVSTGGRAMGSVQCAQGDVLYLALEDNERRLKERLSALLSFPRPSIKRLRLRTTAPRIDSGLIRDIEAWRSSVEKPTLVMIDTYAKVKPQRKRNEDAYAADYDAVTPLQRYASEHRLAIILVTHTRKMEAEDPLETISGTNGTTGAADSILVLNRGPKGVTLYGRGRDIAEIETAMRFHPTGHWSVLGDADEVRRSDERKRIIAALEEIGEPVGPKAIAEVSGMKAPNVKYLLGEMVKAGEIELVSRGLYTTANFPHHPHLDEEST